MSSLTIALLQAPFFIGNPLRNAHLLNEMILDSIAKGANLIVSPECAISGYLPEDLLYRDDHNQLVEEALAYLKQQQYPATIIVGLPVRVGDKLMNRAIVIEQGKAIAYYDKQCLPNYRVFDEKRYFSAGHHNCIISIKGIKIGLFICEDLWHEEITNTISHEDMDLIVSLNASPYYINKEQKRLDLLSSIAKKNTLPIAYVNCVGAQDSIIFDGGTCFINENGELCSLAEPFKQTILINEYMHDQQPHIEQTSIAPSATSIEETIAALVMAIRTYVDKNGFAQGVLIGLSGGIDSAVTLALAVLALGADKVKAVYLPTQYNADISEVDAKLQADKLGVDFSIIPIQQVNNDLLTLLSPHFNGKDKDVTEENLQARIRGVILMALSNKHHKLLLTTGNKSEYAVGYATLYGDMCGGYAPIKDVYKTKVYEIAKTLNAIGSYVPERVITREPSAELSENQIDQQSLPPYDVLDTILTLFIEQDLSIKSIVQQTGYDVDIVQKVIKMVIRNEYKRQQSAPGPRISPKAFGRDRRYPISIDSNKLI